VNRDLAGKQLITVHNVSCLQPDPRGLDLLEHPIGQAEIELVLPAVGVTNDRRYLKAAREVERCRRVVEHRIDLVSAADVERQLDSGVDLRFVEVGEVAALAPLEREVRSGVDRVRRVDTEGVESIAVDRERAFVRELDRDRAAVVAALRTVEAQVINPSRVLEGFVDRAIAIDEVRRADSVRVEVPRVDRSRCTSGPAGRWREARAAFGTVPDDELLLCRFFVPLAALERIAGDVHGGLRSGEARMRAPHR